MKGYYLIYIDKNNLDVGVNKKIEEQMTEFNEKGLNCSFYPIVRKDDKLSKLLYRFPFTNLTTQWKYNKKFEEVDYLYFRKPIVLTGAFRTFLRRLKRNSPKVKIVMELPTRFYDKEITNGRIANLPLYIREIYNRKRLKDLVDRIAVTGTDEDILWGVKTLKFKNGVNLKKNPVRNPVQDDGVIRFCFVARFAFYHAVERFIRGMIEYYKNRGTQETLLYVVGDENSILTDLKQLSENPYVKDRVVFTGRKTGDELRKIYDQCNIGVCSLGIHRLKKAVNTSLKSREYLVAGLPICYSGDLDFLREEPVDFAFNYPEDESPIDIDAMIKKYKRLLEKENVEDLTARIRKYAEKHVGMEEAMENIVKYLKG